MIKFVERSYSKYDDTDALKAMKDSSILNSEEKGKMTTEKAVGIGAVAGGLLGATGAKASKAGKLAKVAGGTKGALIGAGVGLGAMALKKAGEKKKENNFYNKRLKEAKKVAARRERTDWNQAIHGRESYS